MKLFDRLTPTEPLFPDGQEVVVTGGKKNRHKGKKGRIVSSSIARYSADKYSWKYQVKLWTSKANPYISCFEHHVEIPDLGNSMRFILRD